VVTSKTVGGEALVSSEHDIDRSDRIEAVSWPGPLLAPQLIEVVQRAATWSQVLNEVLDRGGRWLGAAQGEAWCGVSDPGSLRRVDAGATPSGTPGTPVLRERIEIGGAEQPLVAASRVRLIQRVPHAPRSRLLAPGGAAHDGGAVLVTVFPEGRPLGCLVWFLSPQRSWPRQAGALLADLPAWLELVWSRVHPLRPRCDRRVEIDGDRRIAAAARACPRSRQRAAAAALTPRGARAAGR
jgi:hypothetical protein